MAIIGCPVKNHPESIERDYASRKNTPNRSHIDWLRVEQNWDLGNSGEHRDDLDLCVHF